MNDYLVLGGGGGLNPISGHKQGPHWNFLVVQAISVLN